MERNMIHRIYLDLDDVLVDFTGAAYRLFGRPDLAANPPLTGPRELCRILGIDRGEFWDRIADEGPAWWANLDPHPWAAELVGMARDHAADVAILTDPSACYDSAAGKLAWIDNHVGNADRLAILTKEKHRLAFPGAVLVDDYARNCGAFEEEGGRAILFPAAHNANAHYLADPVGYVRDCLNAWKN
jgi:5'(3')-deoxyribonucleotidase